MTLRYLSLFSGIGGFDLGFDRAGMECAGQVEIDAKCNEVLAYHWPHVWRHNDVRAVTRQNAPTVDLVCGGFPCQDLSVAGRRAGLAGERSGLWFEFRRVLADLRPRWVVVENVPGLLSSQRGRDFAVILHGLGELGYCTAWRVLDAQYFGVAQRRRRVFLVASLGTGSCAQVLFESAGVPGDSPPRRETGQGVAGSLAGSTGGSDENDAKDGRLIALSLNSHHNRQQADNTNLIADTIYAGTPGKDAGAAMLIAAPIAHTPRAEADSSEDGTGRGTPLVFDWQSGGDVRLNISAHHSSGLHSSQTPAVLQSGVRRLIPTECERLQGFPDSWTLVNGMSDSARYRMLGNAVCVPVAEWIGRRIVAQETP